METLEGLELSRNAILRQMGQLALSRRATSLAAGAFTITVTFVGAAETRRADAEAERLRINNLS